MERQEFETVVVNILGILKLQNPTVFEAVTCCFLGFSGVKELKLEEFTVKLFRRYYCEPVSIIIENDACIALYSGTLGMPGIVQIAGTGAITYCKDPLSKEFRSGGWGYLFDDEGSGCDLAIQALKVVFKAYDKRGSSTSLTEKVLNHFEVDEVPKLIECIYNDTHPRIVIAPLSKYVEQAAVEEDLLADSIEACIMLF